MGWLIFDVVFPIIANIIFINEWRTKVRFNGKEKYEKKKYKIILFYTALNALYYFAFWIQLWKL